jgi:hypothetical protein
MPAWMHGVLHAAPSADLPAWLYSFSVKQKGWQVAAWTACCQPPTMSHAGSWAADLLRAVCNP